MSTKKTGKLREKRRNTKSMVIQLSTQDQIISGNIDPIWYQYTGNCNPKHNKPCISTHF